MEKFKSPKGDIRFTKEIKNIKIKSKDTESFHFSKSPTIGKSKPNKEIFPINNIKKTLPKNEQLKSANNSIDIKPKENEKQIQQVKNKTGNIIKEKMISNIPNKGKGRSLEKVPLENKNNKNNNINIKKKKKKDNIKNVMEIGKKNKYHKRHNSVGKNNQNNSNKNKVNRININEKMKQIQIKRKNKNKNDINDYNNNIENMKNININEEKLNQNKNNNNNNYVNYNIINNNINPSANLNNPEDNMPFKKYNSVCVSINNNYNYNVSLEKPPNAEHYNNFIKQAFIEQNIDNKKMKIKNKDKEISWKEKIIEINKQKNNINFMDFKKLNNTDSNFRKSKNEIQNKKEEKNIIINQPENNNTNLKQKIKKINSSIIPGDKNNNNNKINILENQNDDKKAEPKKKAGILGFLEVFKGMLVPFNLRKKNSRNNDNNNSANISRNNIKEQLNKSNNYKNIDEIKNINVKRDYNTINTTKIDVNNNNNNIKKNVYEKRKISFNKNEEINNYNYYSDSAYDSCPIPNNTKNLTLYRTNKFKNMNMNIYPETKDNQPILSYSHKNILRNNNIYNNEDINYKSQPDFKNQEYNNYKTEDEYNNDNSLFSIFGIKNNKLYKKPNNNIINNFNKNIPSPLNDINYNSAYVKKTKRKIFSPEQSSKSENNQNKNYEISNFDNNDNYEREMRKLSFNNKNINNYNNNYNINFNNLNIGRENKNRVLDKPKIMDDSEKEKYNSENINENLNINAEKKIQEIKININYKRDKNNYNNTINYSARQINNQFMNNEKKYYSTMDDFLRNPKPKTEIESCIINFDKNKNKQMKVYENNLYNKANTPNNNSYNNNYNNNYNIINNFNRTPLSDNYNSYSYSNLHDINNNSKNIYSKPNNKIKNINQSDKNIRREKNLSFGDLNIDINNMNLKGQKPIKKKILINNNEKAYKINRLSDSQEFDNDVNSVNSDSSQNTSGEFNRSQMLPLSESINSIYSKPFKTFLITNNKTKNNNSANNSFQNNSRPDNNKYNTDFGINYNNNRNLDINMTIPGLSKTNKNENQSLSDKIPPNNNSMAIYFNKNNNINNFDLNINQNNNNFANTGPMIYTKKSNSSKNNISLAINNVTPIPSNDYHLSNDNKMNNIRTIIRPKVKQKKLNLIQKLYNYWIKNTKIEKNDYFYSKEYLKILQLPLKQVCTYTKYYYKIIQKPKIKNYNIDKKRIQIKKGINLPKPDKCFYIKNKIIINIPNNIIKKQINEEIKNTFNDDNLFNVSQDFTGDANKLDKNETNEKEIKNNNKEEKQIQFDKELEENIEIDELENNNDDIININDEIKIKNRKYSTPTQNIKEDENQIESPKFATKKESNQAKSAQNKIISIEIQLNNKDKIYKKNDNIKDINKNLSSSYNNMQLKTNDSLYIKKKPNMSNLSNQKNNKIYYNTENDKCKTYIKQRKRENDEININNFYNDDSNLYPNQNASKSNKIICIDIDLGKEQKKLQEQKEKKESKEIKTYKRPNLAPLIDPTKNFKNKIETITINYNNFNNNLNSFDFIKKEIIVKLDMVDEKNLLLIVNEFLDLLTKRIVVDINNNYNKCRLSYMEIISNESTFTDIIILKAIYNINKIGIYAKLCNELSINLTNEINIRGNDTEEDLKNLLEEGCKIKFEDIINNNKYNINDNALLGIILFICELINYRIINLEIGDFCFNILYKEYNNFNNNKYYYLDIIVELLAKYGKSIYIEKNMKYFEKINNYVEKELKNLIKLDMYLPDFLRNKIINLINMKNNQWMY